MNLQRPAILHRAYQVAIAIKGLDGAIEFIAGAIVALVGSRQLYHFAVWATAPEIAPRTVGLPWRNHSPNIQPRVAAAAAKCVATKALDASELACSALPALNPNHPTQSMHAPITLRTKLWGGAIPSLSNPTRFPR